MKKSFHKKPHYLLKIIFIIILQTGEKVFKNGL